jgi:CheY-like chemotaxis protein
MVRESLNILLAENCNDDADLFARSLRAQSPSCHLLRVRDGQALMDYLAGNFDYSDRTRYPLPDCVVLDLSLPCLDGCRILELRKRSAFFCIPFVVWSGRPDLLSKSVEFGADAAYPKEADVQNRRQVLSAVLDLGMKAKALTLATISSVSMAPHAFSRPQS